MKLKDSVLFFPKKVRFELKTRLPNKTEIREVRIIPKGIGYLVEIVYKKNTNLIPYIPHPIFTISAFF